MKKKAEAILVLGVELDGEDHPTAELLSRVKTAAQAARRDSSLPLVLCGGVLPGHRVSEASVMAALLEEAGIASSRLVLEEKSQNTMENMRFAADILGKKKTVQVVTSAYHMRRANLTARRAGFKTVRGAAAPEPFLDGEDEKAHRLRVNRLKKMEACYIVDLLMGWQDEGRSRPEFLLRLFARAFGPKK